MTQDRATPQENEGAQASPQKGLAASYYGLMGLHPSASVREIRQAYRDLSKLYHPDTTSLAAAIATAKFQQLNEAYATLSNPEHRTLYDRKIGYATVPVIQRSQRFEPAKAASRMGQSSAYLEPTDRPLSPGELFALFILGLTFVGCLVLAIAIGLTRGDTVLQPITANISAPHQTMTTVETPPQPTTPSISPTPSSDVPLADVPLLDRPLANSPLADSDPPLASPD